MTAVDAHFRPSVSAPARGLARLALSVLVGIGAGVLLIDAIAIRAGLVFGEGYNTGWNLTRWGDHWAWRTIGSMVATYAASFLAGMIARRRGTVIGVLASLPSALYWLLLALGGWIGHILLYQTLGVEAPLGYRISFTVLAALTVPIGVTAGSLGAAFGAANAEHFDSRRRSFLGVRWFHFLWAPIVIQVLVVQASAAGIYGFGWFGAVFRVGIFSLAALIPFFFYSALVYAIGWSFTGAWRAYEALAGFGTADVRPVWKRVLLYGIAWPLGVAVVELVIGLAQYRLAKLLA